VRVTEVITSDKGKIKLGGKPITASELKQLQAEVKALMGFRVWGLMTNTVRRLAEDKIIKQSTNFDEVVAGKLMLINLDTIESIATVIKHSV
jgi:hypothetical protein